MNVTAIAAACALAVGAAGTWYIQGIRWDNDIAARDLETAVAIQRNVEAVNAQLIAAREQTEVIRSTFIEYKAGKENETKRLELAVADGTGRLSVKAKCPATTVRSAGAVSGGAAERETAELDAAARQDYFAYRRAYESQVAEYQFCWAELKKRSAKSN